MSEKKAKEKRKQEESEVVAEFNITAFKDGNVRVTGPIGEIGFYVEVMNRAERTVLEMHRKMAQDAMNQRIIRPDSIGLRIN